MSSDRVSAPSSTALAITGLACRFPGAPDAEANWRLLLDRRGGMTRFTDDELAQRGAAAARRRNPSFVPVGGVVDGQDEFDPEPFGLTDGEAALLDPQQRLFLECSWHALGRGYLYAPDGPFSADGHTRPFSAEATDLISAALARAGVG